MFYQWNQAVLLESSRKVEFCSTGGMWLVTRRMKNILGSACIHRCAHIHNAQSLPVKSHKNVSIRNNKSPDTWPFGDQAGNHYPEYVLTLYSLLSLIMSEVVGPNYTYFWTGSGTNILGCELFPHCLPWKLERHENRVKVWEGNTSTDPWMRVLPLCPTWPCTSLTLHLLFTLWFHTRTLIF